jgi:hypothetical protein
MTKTFDDKRPIELANTDSHTLRDEILSYPGGATSGAMAAGFMIRQLAGWLVDSQCKHEALLSAFKHNEEWRKTYRAALSGLLARSGQYVYGGQRDGVEYSYAGLSADEAHEAATQSADGAHGPLRDLSKKA